MIVQRAEQERDLPGKKSVSLNPSLRPVLRVLEPAPKPDWRISVFGAVGAGLEPVSLVRTCASNPAPRTGHQEVQHQEQPTTKQVLVVNVLTFVTFSPFGRRTESWEVSQNGVACCKVRHKQSREPIFFARPPHVLTPNRRRRPVVHPHAEGESSQVQWKQPQRGPHTPILPSRRVPGLQSLDRLQ